MKNRWLGTQTRSRVATRHGQNRRGLGYKPETDCTLEQKSGYTQRWALGMAVWPHPWVQSWCLQGCLPLLTFPENKMNRALVHIYPWRILAPCEAEGNCICMWSW